MLTCVLLLRLPICEGQPYELDIVLSSVIAISRIELPSNKCPERPRYEATLERASLVVISRLCGRAASSYYFSLDV